MKKTIICVALCVMGVHTAAAQNLQPVASFLGTHDKERCAYWIQPAGDVNGDGLADFLLGASHYGPGGTESGRAYLILGRSQADWGMRRSLNQADAIFTGGWAHYAGYAIAGGGDVNGDGYDDFIIGSAGYTTRIPSYSGRAYMVFGRPNADWGKSFSLPDHSDVIFSGVKANDQAGVGVSILGDLNGDGYDDLIVGSPLEDSAGENAGKVYLFLGRPNWPKNVSLSSADASFVGPHAHKGTGYCVSRLGDVNGDGIPDFIIGSYNDPGEIYLIFGRRNVQEWGQNFSLANADVIFRSEFGPDAKTGFLVADAGDVNGDGYNDILIGAGRALNGRGKAYLIFGRPTQDWPKQFNLSNADASFIGEQPGDEVGFTKSLGGGGDFNGDGYGDFLIGAGLNDQFRENAGKVYLIYGKPTGWERNVNLSTVSTYFLGEGVESRAGVAVNFVGDINGDGVDDFVASAPLDSYAGEWFGQNYIFLGAGVGQFVSGAVILEDTDTPVPGVLVSADGNSPVTRETDQAGAYRINYARSQSFSVTPSKTRGAYLQEDGITPFDAALVLRQVLELEQLSTAQRERADVNEDGMITVADAILVGRCYAGLSPLTGSRAGEWVFTPSRREYSSIQSNFQNEDYSARLLGDVNMSWRPGGNSPAKTGILSLDLLPLGDDRMVLDLFIPSRTGLISMDIGLRFDADRLRFLTVEKAGPVLNFLDVFNETEPGYLRVGLFGSEPADEAGRICRVIFESIRRDGGHTATLERFRINDTDAMPDLRRTHVLDGDHIPSQDALANFPNPFNRGTAITYTLSQTEDVRMILYNLRGERVRVLVDQKQPAGKHRIVWDGRDDQGRDTATGVYLCRMQTRQRIRNIKLVKTE